MPDPKLQALRRANVVYREIKQRGLPLRVSQTSGVSTDVMWFL